jgi:hypothetical protein
MFLSVYFPIHKYVSKAIWSLWKLKSIDRKSRISLAMLKSASCGCSSLALSQRNSEVRVRVCVPDTGWQIGDFLVCVKKLVGGKTIEHKKCKDTDKIRKEMLRKVFFIYLSVFQWFTDYRFSVAIVASLLLRQTLKFSAWCVVVSYRQAAR